MGSGLLQPEDTEEQRAAVARLETLLALVEGWVDDVVDQAIAERAARRRSSSARRCVVAARRAGPRRRRSPRSSAWNFARGLAREAATLFAVVRAGRGSDARDALWAHPDLLPGPDDLADPLGFIEDSATELEFDVPDSPGDLPDAGPAGGPEQ